MRVFKTGSSDLIKIFTIKIAPKKGLLSAGGLRKCWGEIGFSLH